VGTTIPHEAIGYFGTGKVMPCRPRKAPALSPAAPPARCWSWRASRISVTKSYGTMQPHQHGQATLEGLKLLLSADTGRKLRGKTVEEILGKEDE
jgi:small subunit ribosomal protein S5